MDSLKHEVLEDMVEPDKVLIASLPNITENVTNAVGGEGNPELIIPFYNIISDYNVHHNTDVIFTTTTKEVLTTADEKSIYEYDCSKFQHYTAWFFGGLPSIFYLLAFTVILCIYASKYSLLKNYRVYKYMSFQHMITRVVHIFLLGSICDTDLTNISNLLMHFFIYYLELCMSLWTLTTTTIIFLQLFLFGFASELYRVTEVTRFVYVGALIVSGLDLLLLFFSGERMKYACSPLLRTFRDTSLFLITSTSVAICCLILVYLLRKNTNMSRYGAFFLYVLLLSISDFSTVWYHTEMTKFTCPRLEHSIFNLRHNKYVVPTMREDHKPVFFTLLAYLTCSLNIEGILLLYSLYYLNRNILSKQDLQEMSEGEHCVLEKTHL